MLGGLVSEPDRTPVGDDIVLEEGEQMLHAKDRFQRVLELTISDTGTSDDGVERLGALGNVVVVASPDPLVRLRIPLHVHALGAVHAVTMLRAGKRRPIVLADTELRSVGRAGNVEVELSRGRRGAGLESVARPGDGRADKQVARALRTLGVRRVDVDGVVACPGPGGPLREVFICHRAAICAGTEVVTRLVRRKLDGAPIRLGVGRLGIVICGIPRPWRLDCRLLPEPAAGRMLMATQKRRKVANTRYGG